MSTPAKVEFSRLRSRSADPPDPSAGTVDTEGKRALFSTEVPTPAFGSVTVECSSCQQTSVLSLQRAGRLLLTSVHLPLVRRRYVSQVRCPACTHRAWCRVRMHV